MKQQSKQHCCIVQDGMVCPHVCSTKKNDVSLEKEASCAGTETLINRLPVGHQPRPIRFLSLLLTNVFIWWME